MSTQQATAGDRIVKQTLSLVEQIFGLYRPRNFAVRLWDGTTWGPEPGQPARFTMVLRHSDSLRNMFWPPGELTLAEAFVHGDFDIEGDLEAAFSLGDYLDRRDSRIKDIRLLTGVLRLPSAPACRAARAAALLRGTPHSKERDRRAVTYHYDVSNDFYRLWLDRNMVYSCAYFTSPDDDIDTAQERKLDYTCRKMRLRPGDCLLDIGCGWGALILHAAKRYGVQARGITLSAPQAELAGEHIRDAGMTGSCRADVADYRDLDERETYDRVVSVGMVEHVGASKLPEYFQRAWRLLKPGGIFLNHGIAYGPNVQEQNQCLFLQKYVFPDGELVPVTATLKIAEEAGFEIRDVESLREHYALTLRQWVGRLEKNYDRALRTVGEFTARVWRLYMSGAAHYFTTGRLNVYQALLVKPSGDVSGLPLTRCDLY
ncbi:MAG TPA: cyclopropane-fatty-acyl-phospholipid synthase family protein [Syntrophales bacterium]|nr:cyclopropane-fatty-acyl-phospholipid synthase family protein [Syntrophales bacterium]